MNVSKGGEEVASPVGAHDVGGDLPSSDDDDDGDEGGGLFDDDDLDGEQPAGAAASAARRPASKKLWTTLQFPEGMNGANAEQMEPSLAHQFGFTQLSLA